jgi:hypothetical protein
MLRLNPSLGDFWPLQEFAVCIGDVVAEQRSRVGGGPMLHGQGDAGIPSPL